MTPKMLGFGSDENTSLFAFELAFLAGDCYYSLYRESFHWDFR